MRLNEISVPQHGRTLTEADEIFRSDSWLFHKPSDVGKRCVSAAKPVFSVVRY